jgi:hypothetical protein
LSFEESEFQVRVGIDQSREKKNVPQVLEGPGGQFHLPAGLGPGSYTFNSIRRSPHGRVVEDPSFREENLPGA